VLGDILMKVSHQPLDKFAQHALFDPLGINHWAWLQSPNGKLGASWGLWLRPRDLAKIGQLVLNHGA
jgi:CubicO group peptidase (beta-lactamase class C family)